MTRAAVAFAIARLLALLIVLAACRGPSAPRITRPQPQTIEIGRPGGSLRGIAADGTRVIAAVTHDARTSIEAYQARTVAWTAELEGGGGPIAVASTIVAATLTGAVTLAGGPVRGEPAAAVVALDAATGALRWRLALDSDQWVVISAIAGATDALIIGGSFSGSLRVGDHVVASGGRSDGFVAKLTTTGEVSWLVRIGGGGADAVQGVATRDGRIAIAGTFAAGADLLGFPLAAFDERSPFTDGFVAELDATGTRRWAATFGGKLSESVVGVAIDGSGDLVVAAIARDVVHIGGAEVEALGPADALIAWWTRAGAARRAIRIGGAEFDGVRSIVAVGDRIVVGGFYSGTMQLGDKITAGGGDDGFVVSLDPRGAIVDRIEIGGDGREEIVGLAAWPGGIAIGATYTAAARLGGAAVPAPADPMSGAALLVRPLTH